MQSSSVLEPVHSPPPEERPRLTSFDSGQEFSLERLIATYKLVERENSDLEGYVFDETLLFIPK
jgi:hypothetical protein